LAKSYVKQGNYLFLNSISNAAIQNQILYTLLCPPVGSVVGDLQNRTHTKPTCCPGTANSETHRDQPVNFPGFNTIRTTGSTGKIGNRPKGFF
jgi:hypothetical protein